MSCNHEETRDNILVAIGNTPLLRLNRVASNVKGNVLVKCEHLNPSGSVKDRMALCIIEEAEKNGIIHPGSTLLVEASTGNTAQALSMVAAVKGYKIKIYIPEVSCIPEKLRPLSRYGAEFEIMAVDDEEANAIARAAGLHGATLEIPGRLKCKKEEETTVNVYWTRQFSNPANVLGQSAIANEILEQTNGRVDVFVGSVGTGGTYLGIAQVLKRELPNVKCVAVEPTGWESYQDPLYPDTKFIPGITGGIVKEIRDSGIADEIVRIGNEEAKEMAYRLSREEGLDVGISSGAHVYVALQKAAEAESKDINVVTLLMDRGDRYLNDERFTT